MSHIIVLDLESSGLDTKNCDITEIAMNHYNGEELLSSFNIKMHPRNSAHVYLKALQITKRQFEWGYENPEYYDQDDGLQLLMKYLLNEVFPKLNNKKITFVGQNVGYDVQMLRNFLERYNIFGWNEIFNVSIIDTSTIGNFLRECGIIKLDKMSLEYLARALDIEVNSSEFHGAKFDIETTYKCYMKMKKLLSSIKKDSVNYNEFLDKSGPQHG